MEAAVAMVFLFVFDWPAQEPKFQKINRLRVNVCPQAVYTAGLVIVACGLDVVVRALLIKAVSCFF